MLNTLSKIDTTTMTPVADEQLVAVEGGGGVDPLAKTVVSLAGVTVGGGALGAGFVIGAALVYSFGVGYAAGTWLANKLGLNS